MKGSGTVVQDSRSKAWMYLWWQNGNRRSKSLGHHKTKTSAWKAAKPLRDALEAKVQIRPEMPNVAALVESYRAEKMPKRMDTRRSYEVWLKNHVLPKWGSGTLAEVQARPWNCGWTHLRCHQEPGTSVLS
jgi:hypothetical protein